MPAMRRTRVCGTPSRSNSKTSPIDRVAVLVLKLLEEAADLRRVDLLHRPARAAAPNHCLLEEPAHEARARVHLDLRRPSGAPVRLGELLARARAVQVEGAAVGGVGNVAQRQRRAAVHTAVRVVALVRSDRLGVAVARKHHAVPRLHRTLGEAARAAEEVEDLNAALGPQRAGGVGRAQHARQVLLAHRLYAHCRVHSVFFLPGFSRDFDCFDSENEWDGKVVFVGF